MRTTGKKFGPRQGTAYVLVLAIALLVTVLGMGALTLSRVSAVYTGAGTDWEESGTLALAATEQAMSVINAAAQASPSTWRAGYTSSAIAQTTPMGRGTMSWALKDETDGILTEDYLRPLRVYGIGKVGTVTRIYSVQVSPGGAPLDVLRTALHSSAAITLTGNTNMANGPLSSNSAVSLSGAVNGSIEASSVSGTASGTQNVTAPAAAKTMPLATVFADLSANATTVDYNSITGGNLQKCLLSSTSNPYGTPDPNGVYLITMPSNKTLTIGNCRIIGTLLVNAANKGTVNVTGPVEWEQGPANFPIMVVSGTKLTVTITGSTTWLSESGAAVNFNPTGNPFRGVTNTTVTDDYPPSLNGVVHIIGDSSSSVQLNANTVINGTLIANCPVKTSNQTTLIQSSAVYSTPPTGYAIGNALTQVNGTWRWDTTP